MSVIESRQEKGGSFVFETRKKNSLLRSFLAYRSQKGYRLPILSLSHTFSSSLSLSLSFATHSKKITTLFCPPPSPTHTPPPHDQQPQFVH